MTNNNLREHIAWLLKAKPHVPPPAQQQQYQQQHKQATSSQTLPQSSATTGVLSQSTSHAPVKRAKEEQVSSQTPLTRTVGDSQRSLVTSFEDKKRTQKVESATAAQAGAETEAEAGNDNPMARLRSAPSSAAKPRLLAQSTFPGYDESNKATTNELRHGRRSDPSASNSTVEPCAQFVIPPSPSWKEEQEWTDLDMLDLTETFESNRCLSKHGSKAGAEKKKPDQGAVDKRVHGQKRKSEQFDEDADVLSDLEHATSRQRTRAGPSCVGAGVRDVIGGNDNVAEDDPPPPYSTTIAPIERINLTPSGNSNVKRNGSKTVKKPQPVQESINDYDHLDDDEPSLEFIKSLSKSQEPMTKVPDSSRKQRSFASLTSSSSSSSSAPRHNLDDGVPLTSPSKSSTGRKRQIVADSEDEDGEDDIGIAHRRASPKNQFLYPSAAFNVTSPTVAATQRDKPSLLPYTSKKSTVETPTLSTSPSRAKARHTPAETPILQSARKEPPSPEDTRLVQQVLNVKEITIQAEQSKLDQALIERKEAAYEHLCNAGEESQDLKKQIQACKHKTAQLKRLLEIRSEHRRLNERKKELKVVIMEALEHGLSGGEHHSAVKENSSVTKEIKALEDEILNMLPFLESLGLAVRRCDSKIVAGNGSVKNGKRYDESVSSVSRAHDSTPSRQLQSPSHSKLANVEKSLSLRSPQLPPSPTKPYGVSYPQFDQERGTVNEHSGEKLGMNHFSHVRATPEYDAGCDFIGEDEPYSTVMGTPPAPAPAHIRMEDEWFGHSNDDDDAEMLEAAHDLEYVGGAGAKKEEDYNSTVHYYHQGSREILKESSGNRQSQQPDVMSYETVYSTPNKQHKQQQQQQQPAPPAAQHSTPKGSTDLYRFPWSRDVKLLLRDSFHLKGFRNNQLEAINATLGGRDVFVLMPTGGGKSLCYQLPAIVQSGKTKGITVVISPLLSLMEDQVQHLRKIGIQAFLLTGETSKEEKDEIYDMLNMHSVEEYMQLLYLTPEMVSKSARMVDVLTRVSDRKRFARLVIDEAHCVSQWGHDFRPDYKAIGEKRKSFVDVPMMALTATATENVKVDVKHNLGMTGCATYTQSFNRPNLYYEVRRKGKNKEVLESIASLIKHTYPNQCGIVYCLSRATCERLAASLRQDYRIRAHHYHAGMDPPEKKDVQKKWQAGSFSVIVATIAFGMGIDKSNVRYVIHHSIPKSLEGYYQETGRAGRDGKRSGCYLFYGRQDTRILLSMINDSGGNEEQKDRQKHMLRSMVHYCENESDCRRSQVLGYFSEKFSQRNCNKTCDNCESTCSFEERDVTQYAISAIKLAREMEGNRITMAQLVNLFVGRKVKKFNHAHELEGFGAGSGLDQGDVERLFRYLLVEEALKEENVVFNKEKGFAQQYIAVGFRHRPIESGRRRIKIQIREDKDDNNVKKNGSKKGRAEKQAAAEEQVIAAAAKGSRKRKNESLASTSSEYPASTNVSSPVQQAAAEGRKLQLRKTKRGSSDVSLLPNGYQRDSFVVADGYTSAASRRGSRVMYRFDDYGDDDDDDGAFAPLPSPPPSRVNRLGKNPKRQVGPPITTDERMESLDPTHQMLVEDFMIHAKRISEGILMRKNLREQPFTDTILREMVIRFATTERDLLQIPGIDRERVRLHGKEFLELVKKSHGLYLETMGMGPEDGDGIQEQHQQQNQRRNTQSNKGAAKNADYEFTGDDYGYEDEEGRVYDPNHEIVNLVSDDDDDDKYGSLDDLDLDQSQPIQSTYFEPLAKRAPAPAASASASVSAPRTAPTSTSAAVAADIRAKYTYDGPRDDAPVRQQQQRRKQQASQRGRKGDRPAKASASKKSSSASAGYGRGTRAGKDGRMGIGMMPV